MNKKHKTTHAEDPDDENKVLAFCDGCDWRELVDVSGLSRIEAFEAIFAARDAHEAEASQKKSRPVESKS